MNIPEFTAQASLYRIGNRYRSFGQRGEQQKTVVITQLGGRNFKGFEGCKMDCLEKHSDWTYEQCEKSCRDPGHAGVSSDTSLNDFLSSAGIAFWEGACRINPYIPSQACGWLADEMRRQS
jgi:hypothetical protein